MYAVFIAAGKQYRAKPGDMVQTELLEHNVGVTTNFSEVLLVGEGAEVKVGQPLVASATVSAEVVGIVKGPKIVVYQKKRRKQYDKKTGHRQAYTRLLITGINDGAGGNVTLSAADRTKIMGNIGYAGDEWVDDADGAQEAPAAEKAPVAKKAAAPKKVAAPKKATSPKAPGAARTASPKKKK